MKKNSFLLKNMHISISSEKTLNKESKLQMLESKAFAK